MTKRSGTGKRQRPCTAGARLSAGEMQRLKDRAAFFETTVSALVRSFILDELEKPAWKPVTMSFKVVESADPSSASGSFGVLADMT